MMQHTHIRARWLAGSLAAVAVLGLAGASSGAGAGAGTGAATGSTPAAATDLARAGVARIEARGAFTFEPNRRILGTLHWANGRETARSGSRLTVVSNDSIPREPHVFTIVGRAEQPRTLDQFFAGNTCRTCAEALGTHDPNFDGRPPFVPTVNRGGPGFDAKGDSFILFDGATVRPRVTAEPGTRLHFICSIHNEMQGVLVVE
jgi:hypothetical protein